MHADDTEHVHLRLYVGHCRQADIDPAHKWRQFLLLHAPCAIAELSTIVTCIKPRTLLIKGLSMFVHRGISVEEQRGADLTSSDSKEQMEAC